MKKGFIFFLLSCFITVSILPSFTVKADTLYFTDFYSVDSVSSFDDPELAAEIYSAPSSEITQAFMDAANTVQPSSSFLSKDFCLACMYDVTGYMDIYGINNVTNTYLVYVSSGAQYFVCEFDNEDPQSYMCHYRAKGTDWDGGWIEYNVFNNISSTYQDVTVRGFNVGDGNRCLTSTYNVDYVLHYDQYYDYSGISYGTNPSDLAHMIYDLKNGSYDPENFYGSSEVPENTESNENHLYFNSCDIGFCEPYGATNFSTFGGAYFYVKYQVDDWILEHINEYDIYFSATGYVGSKQYNGSKRVSLDQDGCITIPFSDIFTTDGGVVSNGFVSAVSSKVVDQRFYKTYLYSIAGEKLQNFIDKQNNVSGSFSSAWDDLVHTVKETYFFVYNGGNGFSEVIQDVVQSQISSISTVYKNYKINTFVYLIDSDDNRSGNVGRMFDLYQGSDTSTDNQGLENENPYVDDNEDYLPDIPDDTQIVETSTSGTGVNVYNMTPSQIKLVIDNGFEKFVSWYNSNPSTAEVSTGFWNSFGIFRNNPAADLYNEYFGFLPTGFKNIILGCATIGIVGGVFCAVRRKLT